MSVRLRIHEDKRVTLAGVDFQDLRGIFDAAAINYYDDVRKLRAKKRLTKAEREGLAYVEAQLKVLDAIQHAVDEAIRATFPPNPPLTKAQRLAVVRNEKKERELLDSLLYGFSVRRASATP